MLQANQKPFIERMTSKQPLTPRTCHVNFAPLSLPLCRPISKEGRKGGRCEGGKVAQPSNYLNFLADIEMS